MSVLSSSLDFKIRGVFFQAYLEDDPIPHILSEDPLGFPPLQYHHRHCSRKLLLVMVSKMLTTISNRKILHTIAKKKVGGGGDGLALGKGGLNSHILE